MITHLLGGCYKNIQYSTPKTFSIVSGVMYILRKEKLFTLSSYCLRHLIFDCYLGPQTLVHILCSLIKQAAPSWCYLGSLLLFTFPILGWDWYLHLDAVTLFLLGKKLFAPDLAPYHRTWSDNFNFTFKISEEPILFKI